MKLEKLYNFCVSYLRSKKLSYPEDDASYIISHYLKIKKNEIFLFKNTKVSLFKSLLIIISIFQRGRRKPVAYIIGYKYFYLDKFYVFRNFLIPRADTEHLLYVLEGYNYPIENIIDIGTGTGVLAISLSRIYPNAKITAIDIDTKNIKYNIKKLEVKNVKVIKCDIKKYIKINNEIYDLIISNPPYLSKDDLKNLDIESKLYEPKHAFYGGIDGLYFYRMIAIFADKYLNKNGLIILEIDYKYPQVIEIFKNLNFNNFQVKKDYNNLERVLIVSR